MKNNFFFSSMLVSLLAFCLCFTSCGPSAAEIAIRSAPSVDAVKGLKDKLTWLRSNAQSGGNYLIEIDADEELCGAKAAASDLLSGSLSTSLLNAAGAALDCRLSFKDSNITITLRGVEANRTISKGGVGSIFKVGRGVILVLDNNITLQGIGFSIPVYEIEHTAALVEVESGGTLIMNDGSTITGNLHASLYEKGNGGGVYVYNGGTFIMKGGTIARNQARSTKPNLNASSKEKGIVYDANSAGRGGGVYVSYDSGKRPFGKDQPSSSGTFIKTGGTITGYSSDPSNGNAVVDINGNEVINGRGHAIFFAGNEPKAIDNTIGPEYRFHFSNGTFKESQYEGPVTQPVAEPIAKPENNYHEYGIQNETQKTAQAMPVTPQEALQEYQAAMQKMKATQQAALLEYQATVQTNPAAQQEAMRKYQKTLQDAQQEMQKAVEKYREALQKKQ